MNAGEVNADRKDPNAWSLIEDGGGLDGTIWIVVAPANNPEARLGPYWTGPLPLADGSRVYPFSTYASAADALAKEIKS